MYQYKKHATRPKKASKSKKGRIQADKIVIDSIEFKSKLEGDVYKFLKERGLHPKYEPESYKLWDGGPTRTPFYNAGKGHLRCYKADLDDITYTPDFYFEYRGKPVFVEAKGWENDSFPIRKKMFRQYLDKNYDNAFYFEIRSLLQCKDMMEILEFGKIVSKEKKKK